MEDNFTLTWEDSSAGVQGEEVICSIENEILPGESEEFTGVCDEQTVVEETVQNDLVEDVPQDNIVYLTDDNVLVMHSSEQDVATFQEQFVECQVAEEIVTEQWDESCPEEIIVGSEEAIVGQAEEQITEDFDIPLPMDQDDYLHQRPYPCDFCSRRFRKKANLMNHMVAHQTDRPHGCNLCGVRYIRKCDLMNHLKIHAYVPETDGLEEDDIQPLDESDIERPTRGKRAKIMSNGRKKNSSSSRIKREYETEDENVASSSKSYSYVDEDMRLMEAMENNVKGGGGGGGGDSFTEYQDYVAENHTAEIRYPITDPRKPFVCQHCGVCFAREKALASHSRVHAGDSPFECQKCSDMFWDVAKLREHVRTKHGGDIEDYDDDDEDEDYSEEEQKYGTFYCATCGLSFHRQDNLKRHQRVHIKEEYTLTEQEIGHVCNVCGDSFPEALELLAHAEVHARTTSDYRCMICGEPCADEQAVAAHVQAKHGKNLPPNTCMLCGRTCKDRRTLLKHSWEHSKEKSFACSKCAKTFHNKARLKRHMLSHRNKMVSCDVCGEEFPDGRSLLNHRHSHNSMSARQFPCRECGKTFGSRSSQQIHIRIHTGERPYGCRFCWKAFADGGTLRKHERIHTGEKPYACAVCPRAFNQRVVLREHIRSHHSGPDPKYTHSVTPYCCSVCSDMFATSQDLIVHLIVHCDQNTAMKRQPQVHPRKYKRRRKLKPHELEMISNKIEDDVEDDDEQHNIYSDSEEERELRKRTQNKRGTGRKSGSPKPSLNDTYTDLYNSCSSALENISSIVNSKSSKSKKKQVKAEASVPSRPKMIHTQKTRVPVEAGEDGKVRHKTRTMVTRTQPTELKSATGERIRPRTKNVSYHILNSEKLPVATFPEDDTEQAVSNLLKDDSYNTVYLDHHDGVEQHHHQPTEVAVEHVVQTESEPVPTNIIKVSQSSPHNLRRGTRHIAGSKVVRLVKGGMIITKNKEKQDPENILPDIQEVREVSVKQEVVDASPLHELAELSMIHAQNIFRCEMCSATFQDRNKLLDHVPVHI